MSLDPDLVQYLALGAAIAAGLALLLAITAHRRISKLRTAYRVLDTSEGESVVDAMGRKVAEVAGLREEVTKLDARVARTEVDLADSIRHVSVVRYDAFQDMGGRMSFSAAMLDAAGDGVVLSSINGRSETRTYAKGIKAGLSEANLSPEEEQAIAYARRGVDDAGVAKRSRGDHDHGRGVDDAGGAKRSRGDHDQQRGQGQA